MSKEQKEITDQKALRKEVSSRISFALDHMKALLGEKKFKNRVKKAAKLLTEGLGEKPEKKEEAPKAVPAKKAAPQKTAAPAAKKESAPAKKATAPAKKASSPAKKAAAPAKKTAAKKAAVKK